MNYEEFRQNFQDHPVIFSKNVTLGQHNPQNDLNQLNRWTKKGHLHCLRKGMYVLNRTDRKIDPDPNYVANRLYEPSYISLEYALSFYGLIPEAVNEVTSVSTRKTNLVRNDLGVYSYRHVKPQVFRGFQEMGEPPMPFFMAEPEKAVVDFVYLNLSRFSKDPRDVFERSYRFQNIEDLDPEKIMTYGGLFASKKLLRTLEPLGRMIEEARR